VTFRRCLIEWSDDNALPNLAGAARKHFDWPRRIPPVLCASNELARTSRARDPEDQAQAPAQNRKFLRVLQEFVSGFQ